MNVYINTISQTIDYIEDHISEKLTLLELSDVFNISEYHFNRIFKTVTGQSLKQYILQRKLFYAHKKLVHSKDAIIDIAYDYGFEYPEVFSRAYKKYYGMSPSSSRKIGMKVTSQDKAKVVERNLHNYGGGITVKGEFVNCQATQIIGTSINVNENDEDFNNQLMKAGLDFLNILSQFEYSGRFYTLVNCNENQQGTYSLYHGIDANSRLSKCFHESRVVPQGWFAEFTYYGDMVEMKETFVNDLYRWLMIKEVTLLNVGIGMFNIYEKDYYNTKEVKIRIPIELI